MYDVLIIGAGMSGLAAGIRLAISAAASAFSSGITPSAG